MKFLENKENFARQLMMT